MKGTSDPLWNGIVWLSRSRTWGRSLGLGRGGGEINSAGFYGYAYAGTYSLMWIEAIFFHGIAPEDIYCLQWELDRPPPFTDGYGSRAKRFI